MRGTKRFIGLIAAVLVVAVIGAGCGQAAKDELNYRNKFKTIWDKTARDAASAQKKIDAAYAAGDIETAVSTYKELAKSYDQARRDVLKLKNPEGYDNLAKLSGEYLTNGSRYYTKAAAIVEETGGNFGETHEAELKTLQKQWEAATTKIEKEMKAKRFRLT